MSDTTLATQVNSLATRVATVCKGLKGNVGDLSGLATTAKTSLVAAINEVRENSGGVGQLASDVADLKGRVSTAEGTIATQGTTITQHGESITALQGEVAKRPVINDTTASGTSVYSSTKVDSQITAAKNAVKNELLGGAGAAYDTLKELGDLIADNKSAIDSLEAIAAGHVRYDEAQSLTDEQKTQARGNIGAAAATDLSALQGTVSSNTTNISAVKGRVDAVEPKVTALENNKTTVESRLTAVEGRTSENADAIESLQTEVAGVKSTAEGAVSAAAAAQNKASANEENITALQGQVGTLEGTVGALGTSVSANAASIGTLTGLNTTAKDSLVSAVNEVNTGLATLSASVGDTTTDFVATFDSIYGA